MDRDHVSMAERLWQAVVRHLSMCVQSVAIQKHPPFHQKADCFWAPAPSLIGPRQFGEEMSEDIRSAPVLPESQSDFSTTL